MKLEPPDEWLARLAKREVRKALVALTDPELGRYSVRAYNVARIGLTVAVVVVLTGILVLLLGPIANWASPGRSLRYAKAILLLASDAITERLAGIYALEHLMRESARDHHPVVEVLAAYIRQHSPANSPRSTASFGSRMRWILFGQYAPPPTPLAIDIQAAVTVLTGSQLDSAILQGCQLANAELSSAGLQHAFLVDADLSGANLARADLSGASMESTNLSEARLEETNLGGAQLTSRYSENKEYEARGLNAFQFLLGKGPLVTPETSLPQYLLDDVHAWAQSRFVRSADAKAFFERLTG